MQIKKDIPLFIVLAVLFTSLLINARLTHAAAKKSLIPGAPSQKCSKTDDLIRNVSPLNFITKGVFHIPS